ncbi:SMAD/FHA domain-containing protein [Polychytrium aggregatum]|uniref:SMAD/FHA domain-containing protein n=1 Tax=Polychytrium aggregatum TaxID=110093 RepID=UPI0022FE7B94|nr:SMAD/FHA domain-containing protein [Polychytrium aggregatum]KAI9208982.1 SMAD/FHA domain-containing protein [Polychytrium aggregatum]
MSASDPQSLREIGPKRRVMAWRLLPLNDNTASCSLTSNKVTSLGRHPASDIRVGELVLSATHCKFYVDDCTPPTLRIQDLSSNGTWVNEKRLVKGEKSNLADGDRIVLSRGSDKLIGYDVEYA